MEYGKLQGEISAAGSVTAATGVASLAGHPFNIASVAHTGAIGSGTFQVTLTDGVDPLDCAIQITGTSAPVTGTANNTGADTDTVKNVAIVNAAGVGVDEGFYIVVVRTN